MSGNNFFDNWKSSTISGAINGAVTGAIGGGIAGGKAALKQGKNVWWGGNDVKHGRGQWSFINAEKPHTVVDFKTPPRAGSTKLNDCVPTTLAELDKHFEGSTSYDEYVKRTNYIDDRGGVTMKLGEYDNLINDNLYAKRFNPAQLENSSAMQSIKDSGKMVTVHMKHGTVFHADNIRSIKYYSNKVVVQLRIGSYKYTDLVKTNYFKTWEVSGMK